eukprot:352098-Chlamydomonas_euryale.AAC.3
MRRTNRCDMANNKTHTQTHMHKLQPPAPPMHAAWRWEHAAWTWEHAAWTWEHAAWTWEHAAWRWEGPANVMSEDLVEQGGSHIPRTHTGTGWGLIHQEYIQEHGGARRRPLKARATLLQSRLKKRGEAGLHTGCRTAPPCSTVYQVQRQQVLNYSNNTGGLTAGELIAAEAAEAAAVAEKAFAKIFLSAQPPQASHHRLSALSLRVPSRLPLPPRFPSPPPPSSSLLLRDDYWGLC